MPFVHNPLYVLVRKDDNRFDAVSERLNDSSIKFAVVPNTVLDFAAHERFPKALRVDANDFQGNVDLIMMVVTKKADASINMMTAIDQYNQNNPQSPVKTVGEPVRFCHGGFLLPQGDVNFKHMIDAALMELSASGRLEKIIAKYMADDKRHFRLPAKPYAE